jgi:subtilisin family serine protease
MAYNLNPRSICLFPMAAVMVPLLLLLGVNAEAARGKRGCPAAYERTKQGCGKSTKAAGACGTNEVRRGRRCVCRAGYARKGQACVSELVQQPCGTNEVRRGRQCVCADGFTRKGGQCVTRVACGPNEVRRGQQCVCADGYRRRDGTCVSQTAQCGAHEVRRERQCVCAEGYTRREGVCTSNAVALRRWVLPPQVPSASGQRAIAPRNFVPGQLIVGFKSGAELEKAMARYVAMQKSGGLVTKDGVRTATVRIERRDETNLKVTLDPRTPAGKKLTGADELKVLEEYANQLSQDLEVEYAHPNWILTLQRPLIREPVYLESLPRVPARARPTSLARDPNDPAFRDGLLWHYLPPPVGMNAIGAWATATGNRDIVVAVLDTGILPQHPDIKDSGNLLLGYDFISDATTKGGGTTGWDPDPTDLGDQCPSLGSAKPSWHGTHVAGTIGAATTNNALGIAGINWAVSILPVRVLGRCGGSIDDIATAIQWSSGLDVIGAPKNARKADVINMSLGIDIPCSTENVGVLIKALSLSRHAGVTVVVAAGNESADIKNSVPSGCSGVISVAASDRRGHLTDYSNFGNVTIMAPGGDLSSKDEHGRPSGVYSLLAPSADNPSGVAGMEGTSMAAPHVSAAIALALSVKPSLRGKPDEIERLLTRSAAPRPEGACVVPCGAGLLDAQKMVEPQAVTTPK